jgi:ferredoxin
MLAAIELAYNEGKGLYAMKALAGGALIDDYEKAIAYVRGNPHFASIALGMTQEHELATALKVFSDTALDEQDLKTLKLSKALCIMPFCGGCGNCVDVCPNDALVMAENGKAEVDAERCVLCAYCTPVCSQFAIRLRNN